MFSRCEAVNPPGPSTGPNRGLHLIGDENRLRALLARYREQREHAPRHAARLLIARLDEHIAEAEAALAARGTPPDPPSPAVRAAAVQRGTPPAGGR